MINCAPQVMSFTIYLHKDFVQVPFPVGMAPCPLPTNFFGKLATKSAHPKPDCFVANINSAFMQYIFNLAKTQRKTHLIHDRQADDLGAGFEIFEDVGLSHPTKLWGAGQTVKFL